MKRRISIIIILTLLCDYVHSQWTTMFYNFDTTENVYIDTTLSNNIWQIGQPQKILFNSAYTPTKAILTDTINYYPSNNLSEFIIKTPTYAPSFGGVDFHMYSKYDMDSLQDGGAIYVSFNGIEYTNIINAQTNHWDTFETDYTMDTISSLNDVGFTGRSNGWLYSNVYWNHPEKDTGLGMSSADTIWIKFKFASDGINNNREGWMIDYIYIEYDLGIGIDEIINEYPLTFYPNPMSGTSRLILPSVFTSMCTLTVFNTAGQVVSKDNYTNVKQIAYSSNNLTPGIYYFYLSNEKANQNGKFISY